MTAVIRIGDQAPADRLEYWRSVLCDTFLPRGRRRHRHARPRRRPRLLPAFGVTSRGHPTGAITEFSLPTPGSEPVGITTGSDGNVWFTNSSDRVGRLTVNPVTDLAIAQSVSNYRPAVGTNVNYTLTVTNFGPRPATAKVKVVAEGRLAGAAVNRASVCPLAPVVETNRADNTASTKVAIRAPG